MNAAGPQGSQLTTWAWFGFGEKRNSDNGAAFVNFTHSGSKAGV